jgi:hypothetical protein
MKLLIAIHGSHSQPEHVAAQRETWLCDLDGRADFRYFFGQPALAADPETVYLDCPDGPLFNGIARTDVPEQKTEGLARYALTHDYDYVFKCDDDTYVNIDRLLSSGFAEHDYTGRMCKLYSFAIPGWFQFAEGGGGYWLSRPAMEIVARGLRRGWSEDMAVGHAMAEHGIAANHDDRYYSDAAYWKVWSLPAGAITLHKCDPAMTRAAHAAFGKLKIETKPVTPEPVSPEKET